MQHELLTKAAHQEVNLDGLRCIYHFKIAESDTVFSMAIDSVINCTTGAIVNAANCGMLGGDELYNARKALPILPYSDGSRCHTGDAKITISGDLPCEYVIHAVGPNFRNHSEQEGMNLLISAYESALRTAHEQQLSKVTFCILSAGIFRGGLPLSDVVRVGIESIVRNVYPGLIRVYLCFFSVAEQQCMHDYYHEVVRNADMFEPAADSEPAAQSSMYVAH